MIPLNASDRWYIITLLSLFHSSPSPPLHLPVSSSFFFLPLSRPLFLSLKHTAFPRTGHNLLSVFYLFNLSSFFNCTCCVTALNHFFMRMDASRVCYDEVSEQRRSFWERAATRQRSEIRTKVKAVFPSLQPAVHSVRHHVHHFPQQTHLWFIDLTHSMKNDLNDTIHQNLNAQLKKKAFLSCILFHCFIQHLYSMASSWIHHQSVWTASFIRLSALTFHLTIDKSLKLRSGKFIS